MQSVSYDIAIGLDDIVRNLMNKSHLESAATQEDVERRYVVEAGTEKSGEIGLCVDEALSSIMVRCNRFVSSYDLGPSSVVIRFSGSPRRFENKEAQLRSLVVSYVVDNALARYFSSVAQGGLAEARRGQMLATLDMIEELLYLKLPPRQPINQ